MTASVKELGDLHAAQARILADLLRGRQEPLVKGGEVVLDEDGKPVMITVYPSAAELAAVNTFLKQNNITATPEGSDALDQLRQQMEQRRASRKRPQTLSELGLEDPLAGLPGDNLLN